LTTYYQLEKLATAVHIPEKCYFKTQKCKICNKQGHIAKVCRSHTWELKGRAPQRDGKPPKGPLKSCSNNFMAAEKTSVEEFGVFTIA